MNGHGADLWRVARRWVAIDTNVVSELRKRRPHPVVVA
jgi:hypothetical protein